MTIKEHRKVFYWDIWNVQFWIWLFVRCIHAMITYPQRICFSFFWFRNGTKWIHNKNSMCFSRKFNKITIGRVRNKSWQFYYETIRHVPQLLSHWEKFRRYLEKGVMESGWEGDNYYSQLDGTSASLLMQWSTTTNLTKTS